MLHNKLNLEKPVADQHTNSYQIHACVNMHHTAGGLIFLLIIIHYGYLGFPNCSSAQFNLVSCVSEPEGGK